MYTHTHTTSCTVQYCTYTLTVVQYHTTVSTVHYLQYPQTATPRPPDDVSVCTVHTVFIVASLNKVCPSTPREDPPPEENNKQKNHKHRTRRVNTFGPRSSHLISISASCHRSCWTVLYCGTYRKNMHMYPDRCSHSVRRGEDLARVEVAWKAGGTLGQGAGRIPDVQFFPVLTVLYSIIPVGPGVDFHCTPTVLYSTVNTGLDRQYRIGDEQIDNSFLGEGREGGWVAECT